MKKTIIPVMALAVLMSACSKDENVVNHVENGAVSELTVSPFIESASRAFVPKAVWQDNDALGVFISEKDNPGTPFAGTTANMQYKYTTGKGWSNTTLVKVSSSYPKVYAYFPYSAASTNLTAVPVSTDVDFLIGKADTPTFTGGKADYRMNMSHVLTQFSFVMQKGSDYTGAGNVSSLKVRSADANVLYSSGTVNLTTGAFSGGTSVTEWAYTSAGTLGQTFSGVGYPVPSTGSLSLEVTVDGRSYKYDFPAGTAWESGKHYQYTFTLTATSLTIGSGENGNGTGLAILPWQNENMGNISLTAI